MMTGSFVRHSETREAEAMKRIRFPKGPGPLPHVRSHLRKRA